MDEIQKFIYDPNLMDYTFRNGFAKKDNQDEKVAYDRWGIGWRMDSDGERPQTHFVIKNIEDISNFNPPNAIVKGQFFDVEKNISKYLEKGYAVTVGQYYGLFEKAWLLRGYENLMYDFYDNPEMVEVLLDKILKYRLDLTNELIKFDISFGHSGDDYGTQRGPVMSIEMWRKLFKPRLAQIWKIYKDQGFPVVHHSCGDCTIFIDDMLEIGLDALNPIQSTCMDIVALGKRYGNNLVFYGGIDCQDVLVNGVPKDVETNVEHVVRTLGKHGNMILAPINIMHDVSMENFEALINSVKKYREL